MDRDDAEALERRMFGTVGDDDAGSSAESDDKDETATAREGVARSIDSDELDTMRHERNLTEGNATTSDERLAAFNAERVLAKPPDLPESVDLSNLAPDGTSIADGRLTSPTGDAIGGSGLADSIRGRADSLGGGALGGSRLDPLGLTDLGAGGTSVGSPSDRDIEGVISQHDGSHLSMGLEIGEIVDVTPKPIRLEIGDIDVVNPAGSGDEIMAPGYAQPDPTGGDDVITGESIAAALKTHDPGVYERTTEDSGTVESTANNLADNNPDNVTNYGPEGEQVTGVPDNWAPPQDLIFDPPAEGASAGMTGAASFMGDPEGALGGSMIGSSTPDEAPPPPDPPQGEDPDQGPLGPPGGGGGEA